MCKNYLIWIKSRQISLLRRTDDFLPQEKRDACQRIYWQGKHYQKLKKLVDILIKSQT